MAGIAAVALLLTPLAFVPARAADEVGRCDWPMYGHDAGRSFAAADGCTALSATNAPALGLKWAFPTPNAVSASPVVSGGVVYVGSWDGTLYALPEDAPAPGAQVQPLWTFHVPDANQVGFGRIVSSAAVTNVGGKRAVLFGGGATLYALDASVGQPTSGKALASACVDPRPHTATRCQGSDSDIEIESSPVVVTVDGEQRVLVGMDVHNDRGVGRTGLLAFRLQADPVALVPLWKFDPETRLTYTTDASRAGQPGFVVTPDPLTYGAGQGLGCGGVWSSPAVDVAGGGAFFGTASCSVDGGTGWESMWGVDLSSGAFRWTMAPHPASARLYDDDFGASPNLLPDGRVGEGSKDGVYYAVDRNASGDVKPAWSQHAGQAGHLTDGFAMGGMIGSTATGKVAGVDAVFANMAASTPLKQPVDVGPTLDPSLTEDPGRMLSLAAIKSSGPDAGKILWRAPLARGTFGAPSYANGLIFVGATEGFGLQVFDANTGVLLAHRPMNGPSSSSPAVVGDSVYVGTGTRASLDDPLGPFSGVWAFELPAP